MMMMMMKVIENSTSLNDLERPLTQISRSCHYLMLNISETLRDTDIVSMNIHRDLHTPCVISNDTVILSDLE